MEDVSSTYSRPVSSLKSDQSSGDNSSLLARSFDFQALCADAYLNQFSEVRCGGAGIAVKAALQRALNRFGEIRRTGGWTHFANAQRQRKKVEGLFVERKNQIGLRRLRLWRLKFVREQKHGAKRVRRHGYSKTPSSGVSSPAWSRLANAVSELGKAHSFPPSFTNGV